MIFVFDCRKRLLQGPVHRGVPLSSYCCSDWLVSLYEQRNVEVVGRNMIK
jgi:hypothetical protein